MSIAVGHEGGAVSIAIAGYERRAMPVGMAVCHTGQLATTTTTTTRQ